MPNKKEAPPAFDFPKPQDDDDSLEVVFPQALDHRRKCSMVSPAAGQPTFRASYRQIQSFLSNKDVWEPTPLSTTAAAGPPTISSSDKALREARSLLSELAEIISSPVEIKSPTGTTSRQVKKTELASVAKTIRELTRTLARIKLKPKLKNIFLLVKAGDPSLIAPARELTVWLLREASLGECRVHIEATFQNDPLFDIKRLIEEEPAFQSRIRFWDNDSVEKESAYDMVMALGGDGTVLYASTLFQKIVPPVISFAMGSLGFLTKFNFDSFRPTLTTLFAEGMGIRVRLRLEATIMRAKKKTENGHGHPSAAVDIVEQMLSAESEDELEYTHTPSTTYHILNEVVIDRGPNPTMTTLELFGDEYHYTTIQADGLCIATPTGSTAYNLAAGGSLCHPENPVILVTAICAHTLSFRPIILPDSTVLRAAVPYDARSTSWVSFDGRDRTELMPGDYVTVSASCFPYPSVVPPSGKHEDWIDSISRTLNWNSRPRQKPWKEENVRPATPPLPPSAPAPPST